MSEIGTTMAQMPLACVPGAIPAAERRGHFALIQALVAAQSGKTHIPHGYAYQFEADWIDAELSIQESHVAG